jgi:hypothetical protein
MSLVEKLNFLNYYYYFALEDMLVVFFLYNFIKYVLMGSFLELI